MSPLLETLVLLVIYSGQEIKVFSCFQGCLCVHTLHACINVPMPLMKYFIQQKRRYEDMY